MTSISPAPPPIRPSFEDKIAQDSTVVPDNIIEREGKKYKVEKQIIQHGMTWQVWQGTQAIFLTIFSLGIGLTFQAWRDAIKNKWHNATTGEETIYKRITRSPPEIPTTTKASKSGTTLQPIKESPRETAMPHLRTTPQPIKEDIPIDERIPMNEFIGDFDRDVIRDVKDASDVDGRLEESVINIEDSETKKLEPLREFLPKLPIRVRNLLDEARKDPTKIPIHDLEIGLEEALNVGAEITNPHDKTTIFAISETVAQHYISATNDFEKATELRMRTALAISPAPPLSKLSDALKTEHPKLGLRLQPIDTSLFKQQTLAVQKRTYTDGKTRLHLNAKINHSTRQRLQSTLEWIEGDPKNLFNALPKGFCTKCVSL